MTRSLLADIHSGRRLDADEDVVWTGRPSVTGVLLRVLHVRIVIGYCVAILVLLMIQSAGRPLLSNVLGALVPAVMVAALLSLLSVLMTRSTNYLITSRRVILRYGVVFPRSLSLPFSQIASMALTVNRNQRGDIALTLQTPNHMPYLKLWPHARAWHTDRPQPMLRDIRHVGQVATRLARLLATADDAARRQQLLKSVPEVARVELKLTA